MNTFHKMIKIISRLKSMMTHHRSLRVIQVLANYKPNINNLRSFPLPPVCAKPNTPFLQVTINYGKSNHKSTRFL